MPSKHTILFLYTELASYILDCFKALGQADVDVHVVMYPVNPEAPFQLDLDLENCTFYDRRLMDSQELHELANRINPGAIVCSGWIDSDYLKLIKEFRQKTRTVLALDSKDIDGLKRVLSLMRARLIYKPLFDLAWVPGEPQKIYSMKLGFKVDDILTGFYTTDVNRFSDLEQSNEGVFPKRFVFVGRYVDFKGIKDLWQAFTEIDRKGWELECAGVGPEFEKRKIAEGISHLGFVQPTDLNKFVSRGGVFVLPSHKEPWGVVVHEFAAAGYPLLCSENVGAASQFLIEGENGLFVKSKSVESIKSALLFFIEQSNSSLWKMSQKSRELSKTISIEKWVVNAIEILKNRNS